MPRPALLTPRVVELVVAEGGHGEAPGVSPGLSLEDAVDDVKTPHPRAWPDDPVQQQDLREGDQHSGNLHSEVVAAHARS